MNIRSPWTVGEEREIAPGAYALLMAQIEEWRLWRFEEKSGAAVAACKSALGQAHLYPLGVGTAFYGPAPAILLKIEDDTVRAYVHTSFYFRRAAEVRLPGDRFFSAFVDGADIRPLDGAVIEISANSAEKQSSRSRVALDRGHVDLTGIVAIVDSARQHRLSIST